jgi:hypothetical protein
MRVQAYIELDAEYRTEEQEEAFQAFCSHYLLSHYLIGSKEGREYYHCLLVDADNIPEMMTLMAARTPIVNGCWTIDGLMYNIELYQFYLELHLEYTPPDIYSEIVDGEFIITESEVTEFRAMHGFLGWALPTDY